VNTYCITTIETIERVYRIPAETAEEALARLKTDIFDSEYNFVDEKFKNMELEED
jgi:hypothetical protein